MSKTYPRIRIRRPWLHLCIALTAAILCAPQPGLTQEALINPAPTADSWAALAELPDWSGVWTPHVTDQFAQMRTNPPPWNAAAAAAVEELMAEEAEGRPKGLFVNCLPEAMPSWMLVSHNAMEILFTPGRVTMMGESDSNRLRRIYTDGRDHPADPDPTFHGHSIGHWEDETLVVDTAGILPQTYIAISKSVGVPNNGELRVIERIYLAAPDELHNEVEIIAPNVLDEPWKTTRIYFRQRAQRYDIVEGVCLHGSFLEETDSNGNAIFVPLPQAADGSTAATGR
jgi:hypothetical protein